jgi:hypothetical protein
MMDVITDSLKHTNDNRAVDTLVALYKQDAQDRVVAHINRIGKRLGKQKLINIAVVVTKADKLSPFQQTSPRPTILIPDQLRRYQNIKRGNIQTFTQALSEYWEKVDYRWPTIIRQLFETYEHFFKDLCNIKGDYQVFFVSAVGDVVWDTETRKTRPPATIRPQGIEKPVEWCVRQIARHKINRLGIAKHFLILPLLALIIWPLQTFNKNVGVALKETEILNEKDTWEKWSTRWWALGSVEVQRRHQLLQLQAYSIQFTDLKRRLADELENEGKIQQALNQLSATVGGIETTDDGVRQIQKELQGAIAEVQRWFNVKTDYTNLRNRFDPYFHYQLDCCLPDVNQCKETLDFSQQVSLQAVQETVNAIRATLPAQTQYEKLVCLNNQLDNATRKISEWRDNGMPLNFQHSDIPPAFTELDTRVVVLFGGDEIQRGDDITWLPNDKRDFKFLAVDSAENIKYQASYQEPFEFINNICWEEPLRVGARPFFEVYLGELSSLFPTIQKSNCERNILESKL